MSFRIASSPHQHSLAQTPALMRTVALAATPGIAAQVYFFGYAVLIQIVLAVLTAWASEAAMLKLRGKPVSVRLKDHSALVTGLLLAIAIPAAPADIELAFWHRENLSVEEIAALEAGIDARVRAAFRESDLYPEITRTLPQSVFAFSQLTKELHSALPGLKSIRFTTEDIDIHQYTA